MCTQSQRRLSTFSTDVYTIENRTSLPTCCVKHSRIWSCVCGGYGSDGSIRHGRASAEPRCAEPSAGVCGEHCGQHCGDCGARVSPSGWKQTPSPPSYYPGQHSNLTTLQRAASPVSQGRHQVRVPDNVTEHAARGFLPMPSTTTRAACRPHHGQAMHACDDEQEHACKRPHRAQDSHGLPTWVDPESMSHPLRRLQAFRSAGPSLAARNHHS